MFKSDINKKGTIEPQEKRILLASPTIHGEEQEYVRAVFESGWVTTVGENINAVEKSLAEYIGTEHCVGLSSGTAALHLAIRLAASKLYTPNPLAGTLAGHKVFVSTLTFDATVNPVIYEGGEPVFVDSDNITWNMDSRALERAFELFPDVKMVIVVNLYGTPARLDEIRSICYDHGAVLIEDAAESLGAEYKGFQTGSKSDLGVVSFNGNKIITGSCGGAVVVNSKEDADRIRKWSTQSREDAPWYQHEEIGFNYRMSNIVAGIIRGQLEHLDSHISRKHEIYSKYREGLKDLPVSMNPTGFENVCEPNYWLSCITVDEDAMCRQVRSDRKTLFIPEHKKSCPTEIMEVLGKHNIESRPIWKPMHQQPIYRNNVYITADGVGRGKSNAYIDMGEKSDVSADIFERGLCLPSDIKMTESEQDKVIEVIHRCFD